MSVHRYLLMFVPVVSSQVLLIRELEFEEWPASSADQILVLPTLATFPSRNPEVISSIATRGHVLVPF